MRLPIGEKQFRTIEPKILSFGTPVAEKWSPLIYNFRHYFRLAEKELGKTFRAEK